MRESLAYLFLHKYSEIYILAYLGKFEIVVNLKL